MKKKSARRKKRTPGEEPIIEGPVVAPVTAHDLGLTPRTDSGNAELIAALYGEILRFDHRQSRWLIWDKNRHRWSEDQSWTIRTYALKAARRRRELAARMTDTDKANKEFAWGFKSEDVYRIDAAIKIAQSLPPISDSGEGWDADPWLLGVANGIVDLQTGELRQETQQDRITKHSLVEYDPAAECPLFEQFLAEILGFNTDLHWFVWKAIGYSLTASIREQCLFLCHGTGANGKSTLLKILHHVIGRGYATDLPFSALELKNRSSNDLVSLAGARFATASEVNEGTRLNEARIKSLTGGDPITARRLFHEYFTFPPAFKLWLAVNHKPVIADDSYGMWRRVRFIPFNEQFEGEREDKRLLEKLLAEAPGILTWMVIGCLQWQREGLEVPETVAEATAAYRAESDHVGEFIGECCITGPNATVTIGALWQSYQQWVTKNEEVQLSRQSFNERMQRRGFSRDREGHKGTKIWTGLCLQKDSTADTLTTADQDSERSLREGSSIERIQKPGQRPSARQRSTNPTMSNQAVTGKESPHNQAGDAGKRVLEVEI